MNESDHPKGALLLILVFLRLVVAWVNTYMRLWFGAWR